MRMIQQEMAELLKKLSLLTRPSLRGSTGIFVSKNIFFSELFKTRDGPLRLRSGRSTELAPLLERSWSEREWIQNGAGAELEREFSSWSGAGVSGTRLRTELERSRSVSFFYSSSYVNFSIHSSMSNVERINKRRVRPRLFIILNILLFLFD
jgi:hypothetical protein